MKIKKVPTIDVNIIEYKKQYHENKYMDNWNAEYCWYSGARKWTKDDMVIEIPPQKESDNNVSYICEGYQRGNCRYMTVVAVKLTRKDALAFARKEMKNHTNKNEWTNAKRNEV